MAVRQVPTKYSAHGRDFDTKEEAERYDALRSTLDALDIAVRKAQRALGESCTTADGQRFEFGVWGDYWHIVRPMNSKPYLAKTSYIMSAYAVRDNDGVIEIREEPSTDERRSFPRFIPIKSLYADERAARKALVSAQREWLVEITADIEAEAAKVR